MTESTADFRIVLRGFDPAQVQTRLSQLEDEIERLRTEKEQATIPAVETPEAPEEPASYEHLGERMVQILSLAREEAAELRAFADADLEAARASTHDELRRLREQAQLHAETTRADAEAEAAHAVEAARTAAADLLDATEREVATKRQEAEVLVEQQRAKAAAANAEFEIAMAERRESAEQSFREAEIEHRARLGELERRVNEQQSAAVAERADAEREARRILEDAHGRATTLVNDAKSTADRIRAESEREVAAAMQRRDSINDQLANLRQMLSSLTGAPSGSKDGSPV